MLASRLAVACVLVLPMASAQKSAAPEPAPLSSGTVTGHVICSDTQGPARFADIALVRKQDAPIAQALTAKEKEPAAKEPETLMLAKSRTSLEGSFTFRDVAAGDYYVVATMPGYIVPVVLPKGGRNGQNDPNEAMASFPVVHVVADRTASVEVPIHRGGLISGRTEFDDGAPVVGMYVFARVAEGQDPFQQNLGYLGTALIQINGSQRVTRTDDEGRYRLPGLPPGKYNIEVQIWADGEIRMNGNGQGARRSGGISRQALTIYSPDSFRKPDAKAIEIKSDEPHLDTDIQVNMSKVHSVSGMAFMGEDHRPLTNADASLEDGADFRESIPVQADGSFHFDYVPHGAYKLSVYAVDHKPGVAQLIREGDIQRRYETPRIAVIVADHDVRVDDMALTEAKPRKSDGN